MTDDLVKLVKRLRYHNKDRRTVRDEREKAAEEIERLQIEIERLRAEVEAKDADLTYVYETEVKPNCERIERLIDQLNDAHRQGYAKRPLYKDLADD